MRRPTSTTKSPLWLRITRAAGRLVILAAWLWCAGALWRHSWWSDDVGILLLVPYVGSTGYAVCMLDWSSARWWLGGGMSIALLLAVLPQPSRTGPWARQQAVMPTIALSDEGTFTVRGLRRSTYHGATILRVEHLDATYDLDELETVWFGVQHFSSWRSLAHTYVSFGFRDGRFLAVSVESRRAEAEPFSPLVGTYRNYGLIYVFGDEREIIGARAVLSDDPIHLYPIRTTPEGARAMLLDVLDRANNLARSPEFYNTWENNCTNNLVRHLNRVAPFHIRPWSWRIVLPGHAGRVAYDHGLIDSEESFEALRQRSLVNDRARSARPAEFSEAIRRGYAN